MPRAGYRARDAAAIYHIEGSGLFAVPGARRSRTGGKPIRYDGVGHPPRTRRPGWRSSRRRTIMAKSKSSQEGVYRVTEVIGTSTKSWEDAAANAVATAAKSLRDLRIAEVSKLDLKVEAGSVVAYRARVLLSFKYEG
jgi:flavin-binding protein dodecin